MPLITSDFFNTHMEQLGLKSTFSPKAEQLDELIVEASEWVENYLRRKIEQGEVVEVIRGRGFNRLLLDQWPISAVSSIAYEDDSGASGTVDPADVRILPSGILEFKSPLDGPWYRSRTYTVTYTAGVNPVPSNIKRATALKVVDLFTPQYQGPREQRSVELVSRLEEMIVDLLEPYRRDRLG
jgi:hypothetical protein